MTAIVVVLVTVALARRLNRLLGMRTASRWIAGLLGLQLLTGLSNVVLGWPLLAALLHTGGAAALVIVLTWVVASGHVTAPVRLRSRSGLNVSGQNA